MISDSSYHNRDTGKPEIMFSYEALDKSFERREKRLSTGLAEREQKPVGKIQYKSFHKRRIKILDTYISYLDTRSGEETIIFVHGNPTYSYLWRNIIPHVNGIARCIAPDLLGMGDSGRITDRPTYVDQCVYFDAWLDSLQIPEDSKIIFVCHEWGSAMVFKWCQHHHEQVRGIVHMESLVGPPHSLEALGVDHVRTYGAYKNSGKDIDDVILEHNHFLNTCLSTMTLHGRIKPEDIAAYQKPFENPGESRRAMLTFLQEMPTLQEGPEEVVSVIQEYTQWFAGNESIAKLYVHAEPGLHSPWVKACVSRWPNQEIITVRGGYLLQEDCPEEIGEAIARFVRNLIQKD